MFPLGLKRTEMERNEERYWPSAILHTGIGQPKLLSYKSVLSFKKREERLRVAQRPERVG